MVRQVFFSQKEYATYFYRSLTNNNSSDVASTNIDLFKSLDIKCVDFLSFFKAFNISVFDTSNNEVIWLTPSDIERTETYSKTVLDYTPYVDISTYKKSVPSDFNYYNFKHATSKINQI
jgi:hypothetical protein